MNDDVSYLTAEGATRLRKELEEKKGHDREELSKRLRTAIQQGDLSENADYAKAKEDQSFLEGRIQELERVLSHVVIIDPQDITHDVVDVGTHVTIQEDDEPAETYFLVGSKEADSRNKKISNESPIGRAMVGHRIGEIVEAVTPSGTFRFKILKIE